MKPTAVLLTVFTLVAFAANSIFCRLALMTGSIGALEFTGVRLVSGMLILAPFLLFRNHGEPADAGKNIFSLDWGNFAPSLCLFSYALFFSLAYIQLDAGVGALILFAAVQITMLGVSIFHGNRLTPMEWLGFALAFLGLVYLLFPGLSSPPGVGASLMILAGISWGVYSLLGKGETRPVLSTTRNFLFCLPACLLLLAYALGIQQGPLHYHPNGILLAVLSGSLSSGIGYVLWYLTLQQVTTTFASIAQLAVPALAGFGGILFLDERLGLRLVLASLLILGGILVTVLGKRRA